MLGIFKEFKPKFLKYFGNVGKAIQDAILTYKNEVMGEKYPDIEHSYDMLPDDLEKIENWTKEVDLEEEAEKILKF